MFSLVYLRSADSKSTKLKVKKLFSKLRFQPSSEQNALFSLIQRSCLQSHGYLLSKDVLLTSEHVNTNFFATAQDTSVNMKAPSFGNIEDPTVTSENDVVSQAAIHFFVVFVRISRTSVHFPISELTMFKHVSFSPLQMFGWRDKYEVLHSHRALIWHVSAWYRQFAIPYRTPISRLKSDILISSSK